MYYNSIFVEDLSGNIQGISGGAIELESPDDEDNSGDNEESVSDNSNREKEGDKKNSLSENNADSISENDIAEENNEEAPGDNGMGDDRDNNSNENASNNGLSEEERQGYISKTIYFQGFSNESISMNIIVNDTVSYNGKKHVSVLDGSGKSKSGDLDITVSGNVPENLEVVFKYKNNKSVTGKTPYFYIMLKGYGLEKEEKKWLKAVNKKLKKPENRVEFKINPYNISGRDIRVCTYEDLDGNVKIRKVTVDLDGRNVKLCKKDYKAEVGRIDIISRKLEERDGITWNYYTIDFYYGRELEIRNEMDGFTALPNEGEVFEFSDIDKDGSDEILVAHYTFGTGGSTVWNTTLYTCNELGEWKMLPIIGDRYLDPKLKKLIATLRLEDEYDPNYRIRKTCLTEKGVDVVVDFGYKDGPMLVEKLKDYSMSFETCGRYLL